MQATIYNHETGEESVMGLGEASQLVRMSPEWSFEQPAPKNWQREIPRYKATQDLEPPLRDRYRNEPPFADTEQGRWQYADRPIRAGEVVESTAWPHPSFEPMNFSAKKVLEYFTTRARSRMRLSPWIDGQVSLENGLEFGAVAHAHQSAPPAKPPMLRPSRGAHPRVA